MRYEGKMGFVSVAGIVRTLQVSVAQGEALPHLTTSTTSTTNTNVTTSAFSAKQTAWGLGFAGKLLVAAKSNLHGRVIVGDGLGYIVDDAGNQSAYLQLPTASTATGTPSASVLNRYPARFDTSSVINCVAGYEHWWTEEFRTNIAGSYTKIKNSPYSPIYYSLVSNLTSTNPATAVPQINARIKKVLVNAIYSPVKNIDIGVELMHGMRETIAGVDKTDNSVFYNGATGKATQIMTSFIYKF